MTTENTEYMDGFMLYTAQYTAIKTMTQPQKGDLLDALYAYAIEGRGPGAEADPMVQMAFAFMRDAMDRAQGKYEAKCERNRQTALRREQAKRAARTGTDGDGGQTPQSTNVHECTPQSTNVHECAPQSTNVHECTPQSTNVHECTPIKNKNKTKQNKLPNKREGKEKEKESPQAAVSFSAPLSPTPSTEKAYGGKEEDGNGTEGGEADSERAKLDAVCIDVKDYWNRRVEETGSMVRRITLMNDNRKALVRARLAECGGNEETLRHAIDKTIRSNFANGSNPRGWVATFDWFISQEGFLKVIEGNFDNDIPHIAPKRRTAQTAAHGTGDFTEAIAEATRQDTKSKDEEQKERLEGLVRLVNRNPGSNARRQLEYYERQGELARLGIVWEPLSQKEKQQ